MSTPPASLRMVEVSGAEALWLLEGSELGRLMHPQRDLTVIRPGRHTWEYGRLVVRAATGTGWTVTVAGPAEVITDPHEAALPHCLKGRGGAPIRRTLTGWTYGPHDTIVRLHPRTVSGFRPVRGRES